MVKIAGSNCILFYDGMLNDGRKVVSLQAGAAYKAAVNIGRARKCRNIFGLYTAAIEDGNCSCKVFAI